MEAMRKITGQAIKSAFEKVKEEMRGYLHAFK